MNVNSVCLCVFVLSLLFDFGHSYSPCPDIFNFFTDDRGKMFGQITLQPIGKVSFVKLLFTFQSPVQDSPQIVGPDDILGKYNRGETIRFRLYFTVMSPQPIVTEITVNGDKICTGPGISGSERDTVRYSNVVEHIIAPENFFQPPTTLQYVTAYTMGQEVPVDGILQHVDTSNSANLSFKPATMRLPPATTTTPVYSSPVRRTTRPDYHYSEECGVVAGNTEINRLIHNGLSYERGEIPWLVAIYKKVKKTLQFICGGTLVSNRHVVTAAHCLQGPRVSLSEKDFVVKLGVHDLNGWSDDIVVTAEVMAADIHEFFNSSSLKNDLMILTLNGRVWFNDFIRPACLWSGNTELSRVVGAIGVVAGWGNDELDEPQMLRVPIVSTKECKASTPDLHKLTSYNTLCAGTRDGSGPCAGDSGSGLYLLDGGKWRLRGVVSHALASENRAFPCNLNEYVVYTDTAQYLPWIRAILSQKYFD